MFLSMYDLPLTTLLSTILRCSLMTLNKILMVVARVFRRIFTPLVVGVSCGGWVSMLSTFALVKIRKTYTLTMLKGLLCRHFSIKNSVEAKFTFL